MKRVFFSALLVAAFMISKASGQEHLVTVENTLSMERSFETVEIKLLDIGYSMDTLPTAFTVQDYNSKEELISQLVDSDMDGNADVLIFQPEVPANEKKQYAIRSATSKNAAQVQYCFSRFVPERTDDYAWENNKVAFRTFGPTAQQMVEQNIKGGTLTSGVDAWLKKVEYPIIDKWYEKTLNKKGTYHEDTGEGLDNFHVGVSRGVGGIAVKNEDVFYTSKNFVSWKTITTGPLRTSFVLEYANWDAGNQLISEKKTITLDYGSYLSKFKIELSGAEVIHAGLTLHEKDGETHQHQHQQTHSGWVSYWQPHGDSALGTGIIVPHGNMVTSEVYTSDRKDLSNLYAAIKVVDNVATYYAGFGWKEAKEFRSKFDWEFYLETMSQKINNPLRITIHRK